MDDLRFSPFTGLFEHCWLILFSEQGRASKSSPWPSASGLLHCLLTDLPWSRGFNQHQSADSSSVFAWSDDPFPDRLSPLMVCQKFLLGVLQFFISLILTQTYHLLSDQTYPLLDP